MKTSVRMFSIFILLLMGIGIKPPAAIAQGPQVSYQVFYDDLSPYGNWVDMPGYGYVWIPDVEQGFTPYGTNGNWVFTDMGWTWVSNYPWGWAPFHYGRWYNDAYYGPVWIPGQEWSPGWVIWRQSPGYYGWAPMGPGGYNAEPYNQWYFVRNRDFGSTNIYNYYADNSTNVTMINHSKIINNYKVNKSTKVKYHAGPRIGEAEQFAGKKFHPVTIKESNKPGQHLNGNELVMYKPKVQKTNASGQKPVPAKVLNSRDGKTSTPKATQTPVKKSNQNIKQPVRQQVKQQPAKTQPGKKQVIQQPGKQQPAKQQVKQQPAKTQPAKQQTRQQPVKTRQAKPSQNKGGGPKH